MYLTPQDLVFKNRCEGHLLDFTRYIFKSVTGRKFRVSKHHKIIADALERCATGEITRLIINVPPRYGKTEIIKMYSAWCFAHNPAAKFIHVSYSDSLALDNSDDIREYVKHPAFQKFWPVEIRKNKDSKKAWGTAQNGTFYATAAGGAVTGFGAGIMDSAEADHRWSGAIIIDDPLKPDDSKYDTKRVAVNDRYNETLASRVNSPAHTPVILIMQRIHEEDMAGFLINGGSGEKWHHICLPAINEDGTPLWPEMHSIEKLHQMEQANKYVFASQMMQSPVPLDDGLFKIGKLKIVRHLPSDIVSAVRYWDKAGTANAGCYTAGVKIGKTSDGRAVVMDVIRGQWSALERENVILQTARMDGDTTDVWIEQEPGSGGKESAENTIRNLAGFSVRAEHPTGDKTTRAIPFACQVEAGNVVLVEGGWNKDYIDELRFFPVGKTKDMVDASSGSFNKLFDGGYDIYSLI